MSGEERDRLEQEAEYEATRQQVERFRKWLAPSFVVCQFVPHALTRTLIAINVVRRREDHTPAFFDELISRAVRHAQMALIILPSLKTEAALAAMLSLLSEGDHWTVDASKQAMPGKARAVELSLLGERLPAALYFLRPMSPAQLQEAIVAPARLKGVRFESPALIQDLVSVTHRSDGGLPLLQFALAALWEARQGDMISVQSLISIGGVSGALSRYADQLLRSLPEEQRRAARKRCLRFGPSSDER